MNKHENRKTRPLHSGASSFTCIFSGIWKNWLFFSLLFPHSCLMVIMFVVIAHLSWPSLHVNRPQHISSLKAPAKHSAHFIDLSSDFFICCSSRLMKHKQTTSVEYNGEGGSWWDCVLTLNNHWKSNGMLGHFGDQLKQIKPAGKQGTIHRPLAEIDNQLSTMTSVAQCKIIFQFCSHHTWRDWHWLFPCFVKSSHYSPVLVEKK